MKNEIGDRKCFNFTLLDTCVVGPCTAVQCSPFLQFAPIINIDWSPHHH